MQTVPFKCIIGTRGKNRALFILLGVLLMLFYARPAAAQADFTISQPYTPQGFLLDKTAVSLVRLESVYAPVTPSPGKVLYCTGLGTLVSSVSDQIVGNSSYFNWVLTSANQVVANVGSCTNGGSAYTLQAVIVLASDEYTNAASTTATLGQFACALPANCNDNSQTPDADVLDGKIYFCSE